MKYRNIIFDFDGTLVDTAALIIETMHRTISALSLPDKSDEECKAIIGYRLEEIPSILWPEIPDLAQRYATVFREIFNSIKDSFKIRLYQHVFDTLTELNHKGIGMAIASSRSKASLQEYCSELHIADILPSTVAPRSRCSLTPLLSRKVPVQYTPASNRTTPPPGSDATESMACCRLRVISTSAPIGSTAETTSPERTKARNKRKRMVGKIFL